MDDARFDIIVMINCTEEIYLIIIFSYPSMSTSSNIQAKFVGKVPPYMQQFWLQNLSQYMSIRIFLPTRIILG